MENDKTNAEDLVLGGIVQSSKRSGNDDMKRTLWNGLIQGFLSFTSSSILVTTAAIAAPPPTEVGQCSNTFIQRIGTRLVDGSTGEPVPNSGTNVILTNGISLVSYDEITVLSRDSNPGDTVKLCLLSIPQNCPPGDNRGRVYSLLNYKTGGYVEMRDSQHLCGGA